MKWSLEHGCGCGASLGRALTLGLGGGVRTQVRGTVRVLRGDTWSHRDPGSLLCSVGPSL